MFTTYRIILNASTSTYRALQGYDTQKINAEPQCIYPTFKLGLCLDYRNRKTEVNGFFLWFTDHANHLADSNFIVRMLFKNVY